MGRGSRLAAIAAFVFVMVTVPAGAAAGGPGVGDPFFPHAGNGGYTVQNYDLTLRYDPSTRHLDGHARISAQSTEQLTRFHLDLRGLTVGSVKVNGAPATFTRNGQELIITPAAAVPDGSPFSVDVDYGGTPGPVIDPDGSQDGWIPTDDGAFVAGEPQGAPTWYPANDTPSDKATFTISMTVPEGITAVGNGALERQETSNGWTTFVWHEGRPMATYLATITLGRFNITQRTAGGIPVYIAVDPREAQGAARAMSRIPKIIKFEQSLLGPYPFETVGAIVDHDAGAGYALETQTKPVFDGAPGAETVAHELAHQWFGDSVSLETWPDIWMNEGFATYVQWVYSRYRGGEGPAHFFHLVMSIPDDSGFWCVAPNALPGPKWLFAGTVYIRGAATLQALRRRIGDPAFFLLLYRWANDHRYGNGTSAEFEALAAQLSGQDLTTFFDRWLRTPGKPGAQPGNCGAAQLSAALAGNRR